VGDFVHLKRGDVVPADGILIHGNNTIKCDESLTTGHSDLLPKYLTDDVFRATKEYRDFRKLDPFTILGINVSEWIRTFSSR